MAAKLQLVSDFKTEVDHARHINEMDERYTAADRFPVLIGTTGNGKTITAAHVIAALNRPTLVLAQNKTLAAQLYKEFRGFFPNFFFSSRRRHTRSLCDWSSDVCSSDLPRRGLEQVARGLDEVGALGLFRADVHLGDARVLDLQDMPGVGVGHDPVLPEVAGAGQIGRASCRERG